MKKILLLLIVCSFAPAFIACNFKRDRAEIRLGKAMKIINEQCPRQVGVKTVLDSTGVEEGNVVFYLTLKDTTPYLLSLLRKNKGEYKEDLLKMWINIADEEDAAFIEDIRNAGYGMVIRKTSTTTGRTVNIRFTPAEVTDIAAAMSEAVAED